MKPKRQEDSSCVLAYRFCRGTCHRRDTAGKEVLKKAVEMARHDSHQGRGKLPPCMPQSECGAGHTGYRIFSDPLPGGSQDIGGAFRSRVQRPGVRHRSIGAGHIRPMWQRTDLAQVKRDRHTGKPRKARNTKSFRLRQSILSAEIRRKRLSLPTGEVRPSEHNYDYAAGSYMDEPGVRQAVWPRYGGEAGGLHSRSVSGSLCRSAYPRVLPHGHRCGTPTPLKSIHLSSAAA